jgi:hypothetical protein
VSEPIPVSDVERLIEDAQRAGRVAELLRVRPGRVGESSCGRDQTCHATRV